MIPLYAKYGIALEAHLQNSISTFNADGRLNTIYIRDFEGLRIDEQLLNEVDIRQNIFTKNLES